MPKETILSPKIARPINPISQATRAAGFVYTGGLLGRDPEGKMAETMEGQARQVLENLKAVVEAAGGTLQDVLRVEVYVTDIAEIPVFNNVWKEYFAENPPARAAVQVAALGAGAKVELLAVAYVGDKGQAF